MVKQAETVAHEELVGGGQTSLHSHPGGGGGGLVDKGNTATTNSSGVATITFNTPYANTNYFIQVTAIGSSVFPSINSGSKTVSGFTVTVYNDRGQTQSGIPVEWCTGPYSNP